MKKRRGPPWWLLLGLVLAQASEFPERECCDPIYPLPAPPASTTPYPSAATPTGRSGPNIKTAVAILNCLIARQLCFEDPSCSAILEIIPRVCGPELVACSTVTVTKCQAALRTLQAFPFFKPTCLCREPHVEPECNSFRDFLFDHPCIFVSKKEKDPYPVDALPTCNHALSVCQQERKCISLFDDFKTNCKVREGKCRMDDRDLCHDAWTKLRLSPMFGCICPNNHMKRRCDRIFTTVNHNPCVDVLPAYLDLSGTDSALYPYDPEQENFREFWFPPATSLYPYFLFPSHDLRPRLPHSPHYPHYPGTINGTQLPVEETLNTSLEYDDPNGKMNSTYSGSISVKVISMEKPSFNTIESQLENPLVGINDNYKGSGHLKYAQKNNHHGMKSYVNDSFTDEDEAVRRVNIYYPTRISKIQSSSKPDDDQPKNFTFQSTCHVALNMCNQNHSCQVELEPVLQHCDQSRCNREQCMEALQNFYRRADLSWSLEVAFCLCRKTDNKQDKCLIAQEKLHPVCAQRMEGAGSPTCHSLAELCREERECRSRLENYEQSCAVDSVTKKCAGPPAECRKSMLGILGTELRSNCACKGTDMMQLYDCLGWQRLLWVNPCVVESQKDFHAKKLVVATTTRSPIVDTSSIRPAASATPGHVGSSAIPVVTLEVASSERTAITLPNLASTTVPPRFCVVQSPYHSDEKIREGQGKRLYRDDEPECSEVCQCNEGDLLTCNTVCVERLPCKTEFAFYNHKAPAYQAYRGRCLCYSGKFICMRPSPESYNLPEGVFLFLGYSETDESLLKPHSNLSIQDAVSSLEALMRQEVSNKTSCTLMIYNVTKDNMIVKAKLNAEKVTSGSPEAVRHSSLDHLMREKNECAGPLHNISEKINSHHPEFHTHLLLSIIKMAEVEVKVPVESSAALQVFLPLKAMMMALVCLFLRWCSTVPECLPHS
ncbi:uncharacterized protein LOC134529683 isoform X1 [Bacillus rossius redtenbacheri]|uniref:uncharacterized protein LOC134529683 isoform X1 n=1 Tax=Bacillus rossius redtenbacheri TaxID=93214 RepID=UPI002FDE33D6